MQFFTLFIFSAVVFGAGAMLAPALPTRQPRIGLAAAISLALVMGGAVFWSQLFGWDTLVIDYLLFALMSFVVLGGTLSQGQVRAEARGEKLADEDQGWPGPRDLLFFGLVLGLLAIPLLVDPIPRGASALTEAWLALTAQFGGDFTRLTPFDSTTTVLYAPGTTALLAYLSQQLGQPIPYIQSAIATTLSFMLVWLAYDLGGELRDKRLGRTMALVTLGGTSLLTLYLEADLPLLAGLVFGFAFWIMALRVLRDARPVEIVVGGLMLGATLYASPVATLAVLVVAIPWWVSLIAHRPAEMHTRAPLALAIGVPCVALVGTAPWWVRNAALFGQAAGPANSIIGMDWLMALPAIGLAVLGLPIALKAADLRPFAVASLAGLAVTGLILLFASAILPARSFLLVVILIPLSLLGGLGLLALWERLAPQHARLSRSAPVLMVGVALVMGVGWLLWSQANPAQASAEDVDVLRWLSENTEPEARILNHPQQGLWAAPISQRSAIFVPPVPHLRGQAPATPDERLAQFWQSPAQFSASLPGLVDYVVVPSALADAARLDALEELEEVMRAGTAAVYAVSAP